MTHAHLNFYNCNGVESKYIGSIRITHDGFTERVMPKLKKAVEYLIEEFKGDDVVSNVIEIGNDQIRNWFSAEILAFNFCVVWGKDSGVWLLNEEQKEDDTDASYLYDVINDYKKKEVRIILNGEVEFLKVLK